MRSVIWTRSYKKLNALLCEKFCYLKFVMSRFNCNRRKINSKIRPRRCCTAGEPCQMVTLNVSAKPHISCSAVKYNLQLFLQWQFSK